MDEKKIKELITATGALAEITVLFYHSAMKAGAKPEEAMALTSVFLQTAIMPH